VRFGGHAQACGLTVDRRCFEEFRGLVNYHVRCSLGDRGLVKMRLIDMELPLRACAEAWVGESERFAPFGRGNERPVLLIRGVEVASKSPRTATVTDGTITIAAKGSCVGLVGGGRYDLAATASAPSGAVVLTVHDVRRAEAPWSPVRTASTMCTPAAG
jgi:single-stranded-DNA-specific exonuclease